MVGSSKKARSIIVTTDASLRRHYPYRFKGYLSPRRIDDEDPYASKQITVNEVGKQACIISTTKRIVSGDIVNRSCNKLGDQRHVGDTGHRQAMSRLVFFNELL